MAGYKNFLYKSTSDNETTSILNLLKEWGYKYNTELENDYSQYPYFILVRKDHPGMLVFGSNHTVEQVQEVVKKHWPDTCPIIYDIQTLSDFRSRVDLVTSPSYRPRKIQRVLENFLSSTNRDEISIILYNEQDNEKIQKEVFSLGYSWPSKDTDYHKIPEGESKVILTLYPHDKSMVWARTEEDFERYLNNGWRKHLDFYKIKDWVHIKSFLKYGYNTPTYQPRKITRTLESVNYEEKSEIIIQFNNIKDIDLILPILKDNNFFDRVLGAELSEVKIFPSYIFLDLNSGESFVLDRRTDEPTDVFNGYTYKETYEIPYTAKDIMTLTKVLRTKKVIPVEQAPNYMPRRITRTLESVGNKVLYAFDLDDTLVFSKRFEDVIKSLLKESVTPESILNNKMNEIGVERKDLKYEHGRIYFNDPIELFNVTGSQSWVRKDSRVYLLKPDEYLSTPESMPIKINPVLVDIYNKAENKVIITSRKEKYRTQTLEALKKLGIEMPNYGLNMYPNNSSMSSKVWKAMRLKELQRDCGFTEINYFDDNRIVLKKMKEYLKRERVHVNFYKVKENDYRKYDKEL